MKQQATNVASKLVMRLFIAAFVLMGLMMSSMPVKAQYCTPYFSYGPMGTNQFIIKNSAGTTIFSFSGYTGYGQYVSNTCTLQKGQTYTFSWTGGDYYGYYYYYGYTWAQYPQYVAFYLDANGDNTLSSTSPPATGSQECMYYSNNYSYTFNGTFQIPATGSSGSRRFRVVTSYYYYTMYYGYYPIPCYSYSYGYGTYLDFNVTAQYVTQNDAGISQVVTPTDYFNSLNPQVVQVTLKNYSKNRLTSCNINWSVDGVTQPNTIYWTGGLDSGQTTTVILSSAFTYTAQSPWNPMVFAAWTSNPQGTNIEANSYPDANTGNDRITANIKPLLNDAGFLDADAMIPISFGPNNVLLKIKNYAPKPLTNCMINWQVDGVTQTPYYWTGNLAMNQTAYVNVGTYYFGTGTSGYDIKAWTSNPNGIADENTANDGNTVKVYKALPGGTYTIGPRESDFASVIEATDFVNYWGLGGPVTFLIRPGTYNSAITFTPKNRQFPISFESITRRNYDVVIQNTATTSANDFCFKLDGYDQMTFRNLTLQANGTFGKIFQLSNGTDNITIDGCQLNGIANPGTSTGNADIFADGDVNTFLANNNTFSKGSFAAYFKKTGGTITDGKGNDGALAGTGITFTNNTIAGVTAGGFYLDNLTGQLIDGNTFFGNGYTQGIYSNGAGTIQNNRINNVTDNGAVPTALTTAAGIYATGTVFNINNNTVGGTNTNGIAAIGASDVTLTANNINLSTNLLYERAGIAVINATSNAMTKNNTVQTTNAHGIYYSGSSNANIIYNKILASGGTNRGALYFTTSGGYIADNMITATNEYGLQLINPNTVGIYYNTSLETSAGYHPFHLQSGAGTVTVHRNIFQNNAGGIAYHVMGSAPVSNHNNIFSKGGTYSVLNGATNQTLASWTSATGQDANSVSVEAMFLSTNDLRLTTVNPNLYYTAPMFQTNDPLYVTYEANDFTAKPRTKTFYMGAHSILPTITIASNPDDIIDCIGTTNHSLTVVANADYNAALTYQWYKDGVAITGQTNPILFINNALTHGMNAVYTCKVSATGEASDVTTNAALLYVLRPTKITRQPSNVRTDLGGLSTFEVDMNIFQEDPPMYQPSIQWYRNGIALQDNDRLAGTKSSILTIRDIQAIDYGADYYVMITGKCGSDSSVMISLTELPKLTVDDLAATLDVCSGSALNLTVTAASSVPNVKIAYQWILNGKAIAGATSATYVVASATAADAGDYTCFVALENNFDTKTTTVCKVAVNDAPAIVTNLPASLSVQTGKDLDLAIVAKGVGLTYQWFKEGTEITGETNATFKKTAVTTADEGKYTVVITNPCGNVTSAECVVSVTPFMLMGVDGQAGEFILNQNSPNPFSTTTTISFMLPEASNVRMVITDLYGRELSVLANGTMPAGLNNVDVKALESNLTAGVYFYTLTVNGKSETKTMVVVK